MEWILRCDSTGEQTACTCMAFSHGTTTGASHSRALPGAVQLFDWWTFQWNCWHGISFRKNTRSVKRAKPSVWTMRKLIDPPIYLYSIATFLPSARLYNTYIDITGPVSNLPASRFFTLSHFFVNSIKPRLSLYLPSSRYFYREQPTVRTLAPTKI